MRVLITGGAGYVGTELTNRLSRRDDVSEIVVYDNLSRKNYNLFLSEKFHSKNIRFVQGDILDSHKLRKTLDSIDVVYHLAAKVTTPFGNELPHVFEQINHWGTAELSYILEKNPTPKVFYLSSTSVYGGGDEVFHEHSEPHPNTYYGISKYNGERMLTRLSGRPGTCVIRCGNVYGYSKSMRFDAVINRFMFEAHFRNRISIQGSGRQKRSFVHIDHVTAVLAGLLNEDLASGVYNLVETNLSIIDIADRIKELYPRLDMIFVNPDLELKSLLVKTSEALTALQLHSPISFGDELAEFRERFAFESVF